MFRFNQLCRWLSSSAKSELAKLRQRTGFPIGKCKDALARHSNDLEAAEKWLYEQAQKEGWAKVEKWSTSRSASQGLIGMLVRGDKAAMVEVSCVMNKIWTSSALLRESLVRLSYSGRVPWGWERTLLIQHNVIENKLHVYPTCT